MKLYMKQKVFSWKDRFTIKDSYGEDRYFVEGQFFSLGKKLHIYDRNENEVAFVKQKVVALLPKFFVEIGGEDVAEITKKFTLFKPKYVVNGPGWDVQGDMWSHNYTITQGGSPIVTIHKQWMTWGDTFELDIADGADEVLALAVVLAIDAVMDAQDSAAANS